MTEKLNIRIFNFTMSGFDKVQFNFETTKRIWE